MSRYSIVKDNIKLFYGWDHALGYWYEKRDLTKQNNEFEKDLIEENDSFSGMSRGGMVETMVEFAVPQHHIEKVVLDLIF